LALVSTSRAAGCLPRIRGIVVNEDNCRGSLLEQLIYFTWKSLICAVGLKTRINCLVESDIRPEPVDWIQKRI